jgi:hypothetical protein
LTNSKLGRLKKIYKKKNTKKEKKRGKNDKILLPIFIPSLA